MKWVVTFAKSSIGAKFVMALSGLVLFGFVLIHMLGNLQVYQGQDAYNGYAYFLKSKAPLLWGARLVLLSAVLLHIVSGVRLAMLNRAARPQAYVQKKFVRATFTSRAMLLSGLTLLAFIIYHLLHFTLGLTNPAHHNLLDAQGRHDVYAMFVLGFQNVYIATAYIVAMLCLGLHLNHAVSSMFQTLGINSPRYERLIANLGPAFALLIVIGNISMPISVLLGLIDLPGIVKGGM